MELCEDLNLSAVVKTLKNLNVPMHEEVRYVMLYFDFVSLENLAYIFPMFVSFGHSGRV
jgi:hypothetical protein